MFRTLKRWFSTDEVKSLAAEYEQLCDKLSDFGHKVEGFGMKLERISNRLRMQDARGAKRDGMLSDEERDILRDLRQGNAEVVSADRDPFSH